jgi:hypothetical protein
MIKKKCDYNKFIQMIHIKIEMVNVSECRACKTIQHVNQNRS